MNYGRNVAQIQPILPTSCKPPPPERIVRLDGGWTLVDAPGPPPGTDPGCGTDGFNAAAGWDPESIYPRVPHADGDVWVAHMFGNVGSCGRLCCRKFVRTSHNAG